MGPKRKRLVEYPAVARRVLRLGRHVEHDPRSRGYSAGTAEVVTRMHRHYGAALDQGAVGACTGFALAQCLNAAPFAALVPGRLKAKDGMALYGAATRLDQWPGEYPPDDTGSSGLAVAKAAKARGWITGYGHSFSLKHLLGALSWAPGILGVSWYDSFDVPLSSGECALRRQAGPRGGHEVAMIGVDVARRRVWCVNSWGRWGYRGTGRFFFSWGTLERLLDERGDALFPRI